DFDEKRSNPPDNNNIHERSRRLLLKMHNTLASQQELSGVQVASYILDFPDYYTNHEFQKICLIVIEYYLEKCLHDAKNHQNKEHMIDDNHAETPVDNFQDNDYHNMNEQFLIEPSDDNKIVLINTRIDYELRSNKLENYCLYDYISWFKKKIMDKNDQNFLAQTKEQIVSASRGRPANDRYKFLPQHPQYSSHILMKWTKPRIPVLIGPMIPRRERVDTRERYCRAILTLFVPWRSISDLCNINQTWEEAFNTKQNLITPDMRRIIENIQLLHECKKDRNEHLLQLIQESNSGDIDGQVVLQQETDDNNNDDYFMNEDDVDQNDILNLIADIDDTAHESTFPSTIMKPEIAYFNDLLASVTNAHRFPYLNEFNDFHGDQLTLYGNNNHKDHLILSTPQMLKQNKKWQLDLQTERQKVREITIHGSEINDFNENSSVDKTVMTVIRSDSLMDVNSCSENQDSNIESVTTIVAPVIAREQIIKDFTLNEDQTRAFLIITSHLDQDSFLKTGIDTIQKQLLMFVPGPGGTGKSQLIGALSQYFLLTKRSHKLRKLAPTAIAATNIDGMTIHSFLKQPRKTSKKKQTSTSIDDSIRNEWRHIEYIFIDEISMVGLRLFARFHELLTIAKSSDPSVPFGGINIVLFGDFIQYSPVLDKALFTDVFVEVESSLTSSVSEKQQPFSEHQIQCQVGRALFLQFDVVVKLTIQMRVEDKDYSDALDRMRLGECKLQDYDLFRSLVVGRQDGVHSLSNGSWSNAPILVYRNEIRTELNNRAVINKCRELNYPLVVCLAQDRVKSKKIDDKNLQQLRRFLLSLPDNKTESLPGYLPLVPGMPIILTDNIATELGLSNGTQGIFHQIVYEESDSNALYSDAKFPK
ncbi:unnamed protein product, partial [Adineta steineri]